MASAPLFDDTYTGPRWTYALLLRPFSSYNLPKESEGTIILWSNKPHPDYFHGTFQTSAPISETLCRHFDLVLVEEPWRGMQATTAW